MTKTKSLTVALLTATLALTMSAAQQVPATVSVAVREITRDRIRAHMAFLADDLLEGRETGTRGFNLAARYVASQFQELGLRSIGGSHLQQVAIRRARVDESRSSLALVRNGSRQSLVYGKDFVTYGETGATDVRVSGEVVFVGDGVTAPRDGIDAYRGLNVVGKVVVATPGAPAALTPSESSYFGDAETKAANAAAHGAAALLLVAEEHIPWELRVRAARQLGASQWLPEAPGAGPGSPRSEACDLRGQWRAT